MYERTIRRRFWALLGRGLSVAANSRELKISRQTAYNWKRSGGGPGGRKGRVRYGPRRGPGSVLDPFREWIGSRLSAYPELSAVRLFSEIRDAGYAGGYDLVKRHVREVRPRPRVEPVVRFETPPGLQGQVDFAKFRLPWGKRHALLVVLGYSRLLWFQFYRRETMEVLMRGLESAFAYFGGVPRELLFDQMKSVVIEDRRASGGELLRNAEFLRFASHWGFRVRACRPYRAQTKGKVERPVGYIRKGFFYGREFASDGDLNDRALRWLSVTANARVHATLKEVPAERFEEERAVLGALAGRPYAGIVPALPASVAAPAARSVRVERRSLRAYALSERVS